MQGLVWDVQTLGRSCSKWSIYKFWFKFWNHFCHGGITLVAPTGCSIRYLSIQLFVIKKNTEGITLEQSDQSVCTSSFFWTATKMACWYPQEEIPGEIRWANIMTAQAELPRYPLDFRLLSGHQWFSREASGNLILLKWTKYISGWWLTYPSEKYIKIWVHQLG